MFVKVFSFMHANNPTAKGITCVNICKFQALVCKLSTDVIKSQRIIMEPTDVVLEMFS